MADLSRKSDTYIYILWRIEETIVLPFEQVKDKSNLNNELINKIPSRYIVKTNILYSIYHIYNNMTDTCKTCFRSNGFNICVIL